MDKVRLFGIISGCVIMLVFVICLLLGCDDIKDNRVIQPAPLTMLDKDPDKVSSHGVYKVEDTEAGVICYVGRYSLHISCVKVK